MILKIFILPFLLNIALNSVDANNIQTADIKLLNQNNAFSNDIQNEGKNLRCFVGNYSLDIDNLNYKSVENNFDKVEVKTYQQSPPNLRCGLEVTMDKEADKATLKYGFYKGSQCLSFPKNSLICTHSLQCNNIAVRCCLDNKATENTPVCNNYLVFETLIHGEHDIANLCTTIDGAKCFLLATKEEVKKGLENKSGKLQSNLITYFYLPVLFLYNLTLGHTP